MQSSVQLCSEISYKSLSLSSTLSGSGEFGLAWRAEDGIGASVAVFTAFTGDGKVFGEADLGEFAALTGDGSGLERVFPAAAKGGTGRPRRRVEVFVCGSRTAVFRGEFLTESIAGS